MQISIPDTLIPDTLKLAQEAHKGQKDKSGSAFITHPYRVMLRIMHATLPDESIRLPAMTVGLLHDVIEDTPWTREMLAERGYDAQILDALDLVTHYKEGRDSGLTFLEWVEFIAKSENLIAILVKMADLSDNSDPRRALPASYDALMMRYERAKRILHPAMQKGTQLWPIDDANFFALTEFCA